MAPDPNSHLPLNPATFHILLALASEDRHGYSIMQEVVRHSDGRYRIGPGTLYDSLDRLSKQGLVAEVPGPEGAAARRRYYQLTTLGRGVLAAEVARLQVVLAHAKRELGEVLP